MSKRVRMLLILAIVAILVMALTASASAAWVYDGGQWKYVPDFCYRPDWWVRWVYGFSGGSEHCIGYYLGYVGH